MVSAAGGARVVRRSSDAFVQSLVLAIAAHLAAVLMLGSIPPPTFVPRVEPERSDTLVVVDVLDVAQVAPLGVAVETPGSAAEPRPAGALPSLAPTTGPRPRRTRARPRPTVPPPSAELENHESDVVTPLAELTAEEMGLATAPETANEAGEPSTSVETDTGGPGGDGSGPGGLGAGGSVSTTAEEAPSVPSDPCGAPWTGVWEGHSRDGAHRYLWSEFRLILEQHGRVITGTMFRLRRRPNATSRCEFEFLAPHAVIWHGTTPLSGTLDGDRADLTSWSGHSSDYVLDCGMSADEFARDLATTVLDVRFLLRVTRMGHATGTWELFGDREFGIAQIQFTRVVCAPGRH
jgi:hypothetical protein